MAGWIKMHRALQKWEWYNDSQTLHIFITILLNANHEDGRWRGHEVKRGQWITGRKKLAEITGISEQSVRTILKRLEDSQELTIKPTSRFSLITVIKWGSYQVVEQEINQQTDQQSTSDQPTNNQQSTTNKNEENEDNEKKLLTEIINLIKPEFKTLTPAQLGAAKDWLKKGKTLEDLKVALIKTAGSERSATRWGWIVDEMNKDTPEVKPKKGRLRK